MIWEVGGEIGWLLASIETPKIWKQIDWIEHVETKYSFLSLRCQGQYHSKVRIHNTKVLL